MCLHNHLENIQDVSRTLFCKKNKIRPRESDIQTGPLSPRYITTHLPPVGSS